MSNDDKKKEERKSVYRFDNEDWVIPSKDLARKMNPKKYKKSKSKSENKKND
jgi:hypothetical protein